MRLFIFYFYVFTFQFCTAQDTVIVEQVMIIAEKSNKSGYNIIQIDTSKMVQLELKGQIWKSIGYIDTFSDSTITIDGLTVKIRDVLYFGIAESDYHQPLTATTPHTKSDPAGPIMLTLGGASLLAAGILASGNKSDVKSVLSIVLLIPGVTFTLGSLVFLGKNSQKKNVSSSKHDSETQINNHEVERILISKRRKLLVINKAYLDLPINELNYEINQLFTSTLNE